MTQPLTDDEGQEVGPHECQNGCGRRTRIILIDLDDGTADRLCGICHLALLMAVAEQVPPPDVAAVQDTAAAGA